MPGHKKGYYKKKRQTKKAEKERIAAEEEDEDLENFMREVDDENIEDFVAPEGDDLDEADDMEFEGEEDMDDFDEEDGGIDEDDLLGEGEAELDGEGDFGDFDEEEGEGEEMEGGDFDEEEEEEKRIIIDNNKLKMVVKGVNTNARQALKMFLKIFRGVVLQGHTEDEEEDGKKKRRKKQKIAYEVESGKVYNKIITFALTKFPHALKYQIEHGGLRAGTDTLAKHALILCNSYFANLLKLVQKTHDKNILAYVLTNTVILVKMISYVPVYLRKFIHLLIGFWASNESNIVKFKAFLNLRAICADLPDDKIESIYRKMYLTFIKDVKHVNWYKYDQIRFMVNCYVELLSLNKNIAYIVGFSYIRTIALHLKNCMKERTRENIFKIYNWQFLNSIRLWLSAIGAYPDKNDLGRLAHPLIEITLGILRFYPNIRYAPFRLHLVEYMNDFSRKSGIVIPVTPYLLEMLKEVDLKKKRDKSSTKQFDFTINIKVQKQVLKTHVFYEQLFKRIINELVETYSNLTNFISYSETLVPTRIYLRKILKDMRVPEPKLELKRLIQLLDENEQDLNKARDLMELSKDASEVSAFTRDYNKKILKTLNINKLSAKIKRDAEEYIKQNILSEQEKFYAGENENEQEEDEDGEYDNGAMEEEFVE